MLQARSIDIVQESFENIRPVHKRFSRVFFDRVIELDPAKKELLVTPKDNRPKLYKIFEDFILKLNIKKNEVVEDLTSYGAKSKENGLVAEDFPLYRGALLFSLSAALGADFTYDVRRAWIDVIEYCEKVIYLSMIR